MSETAASMSSRLLYEISLQLFEHFVEIAEEKSFLVGILAVAQRFGMVAGGAERTETAAVEIVENRRVVARRYGKRLFGEPVTVVERRCRAFLVEELQQRSVLRFGSYDDDVLEIFGGGAYQRYAAYVYFLDDSALVGSRSDGFFKGIEIDDDEVDFGNFVFGNLPAVAVVVAAVENAAEYFGVQGFHPTAQYRGIAGEALYGAAGYAQRLDESLRAAGGDKFHALGVQFFQYLI